MMQSCRHRGKACFSRAHDFQPHSLYWILAGLLSNTTVDSQYAIKRDHHLIASGDKSSWCTPRPKRLSRPEHDMTKGFMTSADDMRPEATLLIGLG
jgi:hypothetical protein